MFAGMNRGGEKKLKGGEVGRTAEWSVAENAFFFFFFFFEAAFCCMKQQFIAFGLSPHHNRTFFRLM